MSGNVTKEIIVLFYLKCARNYLNMSSRRQEIDALFSELQNLRDNNWFLANLFRLPHFLQF